MHTEGWFTTITVWRGKDPRPVLFTGDNYQVWGLGQGHTPAADLPMRNHGNKVCWAQALHDVLEGWHACVMHAGDDLFIIPEHPDFGAVETLWNLAQHPEDAETRAQVHALLKSVHS